MDYGRIFVPATSPSTISWASRIAGAHMTTRWDRLANHKGSLKEQTRPSSTISMKMPGMLPVMSESALINAEIAGDTGVRNISRPASIDKVRINGAIIVNRYITKCELKRMSFGPRLVRPDGTAIYTFQKK